MAVCHLPKAFHLLLLVSKYLGVFSFKNPSEGFVSNRCQWRLDPISAQDVDIIQSHAEQLNLDGTSPCVPYCEDHIDDTENLTKEPVEVKTIKQAKHIELPETCIRKTDVVKIERLCEVLDEWCTFDTYKFFKSKVYNQSCEECGKLLHCNCSVFICCFGPKYLY